MNQKNPQTLDSKKKNFQFASHAVVICVDIHRIKKKTKNKFKSLIKTGYMSNEVIVIIIICILLNIYYYDICHDILLLLNRKLFFLIFNFIPLMYILF